MPDNQRYLKKSRIQTWKSLFKKLMFKNWLNSQAPDVPELTHQGIFQLSRLSVNCYVKTMKNIPFISKKEIIEIK